MRVARCTCSSSTSSRFFLVAFLFLSCSFAIVGSVKYDLKNLLQSEQIQSQSMSKLCMPARMLHVEYLPVMTLLLMRTLPFVWLHILALQEGLRIHCGSFLVLRVESGTRQLFRRKPRTHENPRHNNPITCSPNLFILVPICSHFGCLWAFWIRGTSFLPDLRSRLTRE